MQAEKLVSGRSARLRLLPLLGTCRGSLAAALGTQLFYAFTHDPYPHNDMKPIAQRLFKIFGPSRMLWASDFPWITEEPGYKEQLALVDYLLPELNTEDRSKICGGNAEKLFIF